MRNQQRWLSWVIIAFMLAVSERSARGDADFQVLHSFGNFTNNAPDPWGQPLLIGGMLHVFTDLGGTTTNGTVMQVYTNGGFNPLYSFLGGTNGATPCGSPVLSGSQLYGMTYEGGGTNNNGGVVFGMSTNGTGYKVLHTFLGGSSDGEFPYGTPTVNGSTLYGTTAGGGDLDQGVVFKMETNGTGFVLLHSFEGGNDDGYYPPEGVIVSSSMLYGAAEFGGSNDDGVVYGIDTNGGSFTILHHFMGGTDGAFPLGMLTLIGSTLYGTATSEGTNGAGVLFKVETNGTGYAILHHFGGGTDDGDEPLYGPLVIANSTIYGTTQLGGAGGQGVVFQMNMDGSHFNVLHSFFSDATGNPINGASPWYAPIFSGSTLYGTTLEGGSDNRGTLYLLRPVPNTSLSLRITKITRATTDVVITWITSGAQTDVVQVTRGDAKGDFTNNFTNLSGLIIIPGSVVTTNYVDAGGATNYPSRYYRVRLVP